MDIKITIPTELKDIKLKDFQRVAAAIESNEAITDIELIAVYYDIDVETVKGFKNNDVTEIVLLLKQVLNTSEAELVRITKINDIEFGFIPNLNDITYGEYLNITEYIKDPSTYHKLMANLYRPVVKRRNQLYDIEAFQDTDKYSDLMKDVTMDVFLGAISFFLHLQIHLEIYMENYMKKATTTTQQLKK